MSRSHPPALLTTARRVLVDECGPLDGRGILVAASGGPDSMALLHVLARLAPRLGLRLWAHSVDHGLRPEARCEVLLVEELSRSLGVPFSTTALRLAEGGNLQARARRARYAALRAEACRLGAGLIATGHHADDRAETVLIRLLRGAGPGGLGVLPPRDGDLIRPLIRARRSHVLAHVRRHRLIHADDPSNHDARFLRVRVRQELMPVLETLSPGIVSHLTGLADDLKSHDATTLAAPDGHKIVLGRAQRAALGRLLGRRSARQRVRLRGGWEVRFDPATGRLTFGG